MNARTHALLLSLAISTVSLATPAVLSGAAGPSGQTGQAQAGQAQAAADKESYKPIVGMPGRDAVWVPTSHAMIEKMLDVAKVTPKDFVMDLGSGDGRAIIAAAKRGVRGRGVEFNPELVEFSKREAAAAGVADKAEFVQGDMYEADISKATVLALFLLPSNLEKLKGKFLDLPPGSRIVANTFWVEGWEPDHTEKLALWELLDAEAGAGITLTESMAMWPGASVSGVYYSHPQAQYFVVGRIGRDQVADYAARKGWTMAEAERWLSPNLGYEPED